VQQINYIRNTKLKIMKKHLFALLVILFSLTTSKAQLIFANKKDLPSFNFKDGKTTVLLTNDEELNTAFKEDVKENWKINDVEFMTTNELLAGKKLEKYFLMLTKLTIIKDGPDANYCFLGFGKSDQAYVDKLISKYNKNKKKPLDLSTVGDNIVGSTIDISSISEFYTISSFYDSKPTFINKQELITMLPIHILNVNWLLSNDIKVFYPENDNGIKNNTCFASFNAHSCDLKKLTLLVLDEHTVEKHKVDESSKGFDLAEFKKYYSGEVKIVSDDEFNKLFKSENKEKYCVLTQGVYEHVGYTMTYRLDGKPMFGFYIMAGPYGYSTSIYKGFQKYLCNKR
jgi:hypothetical protein